MSFNFNPVTFKFLTSYLTKYEGSKVFLYSPTECSVYRTALTSYFGGETLKFQNDRITILKTKSFVEFFDKLCNDNIRGYRADLFCVSGSIHQEELDCIIRPMLCASLPDKPMFPRLVLSLDDGRVL